jgi:divinyl protochlorophyllide a 8-vinyl-reductase
VVVSTRRVNMHGPTTLPDDPDGRIGPNSVVQLIAALQSAGFDDQATRIFRAAGVAHWLSDPPSSMADERQVASLHQQVRAQLSPSEATLVMTEAGSRTADYLLAFRIPRLAKAFLRVLPQWLAGRCLVHAIDANAWTFAGSGVFKASHKPVMAFELHGNPLCRGERSDAPVCAWNAAVFQHLFRTLVARNIVVVETSCAARGDAFCRFEIRSI